MKIGQDVGVIESSTGKFLLNGIEVQSIQSNALTLVKSAKKRTLLYKLVIDKNNNIEIKANTRTQMMYTTLRHSRSIGVTPQSVPFCKKWQNHDRKGCKHILES